MPLLSGTFILMSDEKRFSPFPSLSTGRLSLRDIELEDAPQVLRIRSNEAVNQYINRKPPQTISDAEAFITRISNETEMGKIIFWAIARKDDPEMLGSVCFWNLSDDGKTAELGYELHPDFQGQGLMSEAIQETVDFGFSALDFEQIEAYTHRGNTPSIRLLRKLGFVHDPAKKDDDVPENQVFILGRNHLL